MLSVNPQSRLIARYKPRNEVSHSKATNHRQQNVLPVTGTTKRTRSCRFCQNSGHGVGLKCPKIIYWGGELLTLNKDKSHHERLRLVLDLRAENSSYKIEELPNEFNTLPVINNMHDKAKGLVVHKGYCSAKEHKLVLQCTILKELGVPCKVNQNVLVNIHAVDKYVRKGITTVIIKNLVRKSFVEGFLQNSLPQMS